MHVSFQDRSLVRGLVAAMLLVGASACSRSDRSLDGEHGSQTGAVSTAPDSQPAGAGQSSVATDTAAGAQDTHSATSAQDTHTATSGHAPKSQALATTRDTAGKGDREVSGYQPMRQDTSAAASSDTVAVGDSTHVGKVGERLEPTHTEQANADTTAGQPESQRVRPPEDSSETFGTTTADSAAADTMARDTTGDIGQVHTSPSHSDTVAVAESDSATLQAQVDTSAQQPDTPAQATTDTAAIQVHADTTTHHAQTEVAVETQHDSAAVVGDSAQVGKTGERLEPNAADAQANADTLATETERVRPPEDSTEVFGRVNTTDSMAAETDARAEVQANAEVPANQDVEAVGDANVESVGAAGVESTGGTITGAAAVSAMTREGQRCMVLDPEQSADVRWDLASSPASLNPCGTGTMTLPRIWTGERD